MLRNTYTQKRMSASTYICTHAYGCFPSLSYMHALSSHVTVKDLFSSYNLTFSAWVWVNQETRQIIRLSKMHEKHLQKTDMLSEVVDQRPANSIKILSPKVTPPHTTKANNSHSPHTNQPSVRKG